MPPLRPTKTRASSLAASTSLLMASGAFGAGFGSSNNVAAYWGQNSFGQANGPQAQQSLATYCADTDVDIIPLAFVIQLTGGYNSRYNTSINSFFALNETAVTSTDGTNAAGEQRMVVNFANAGDNCSIFSGTGLLDCGETIGKDITTCQEQYNKTILLSIGGATYTEGGFPSEDAAISAAEMVWKTFGPAADGTESERYIPSQADSLTTSLAASNAQATDVDKILLTSVSVDATETGTPLASPASAVSSSTNSTGQQQPAGDGVEFVTSDENPGSALNTAATATSTGNEAMDINTIPTVNPTNAEAGADPSDAAVTSDSAAISDAAATSDSAATLDSAARSDSPATSDSAAVSSSVAAQNASLLSVVTSTVYRTATTTEFASEAAATGAVNAVANSIISSSTVASNSFANVTTARARRRQAAQVLRPFGNAVIDGFDIDIESTTQNFLPFVRRLRELMDANAAKQYYLTAAPQCPYPDAAVSDLLDSDVRFDAVFVQFYNNYCGVQSYSNTSDAQASFNFESWDTWAKNATSRYAGGNNAGNTTSLTKRQSSATPANVKVFLGVPGGVTGAGSGYATLEQLSPVIEYSQKFESFGGVMVWDITQAKANEKWLPGVKQVLLNNAEGRMGTFNGAAANVQPAGVDASNSTDSVASSATGAVITDSASDLSTNLTVAQSSEDLVGDAPAPSKVDTSASSAESLSSGAVSSANTSISEAAVNAAATSLAIANTSASVASAANDTAASPSAFPTDNAASNNSIAAATSASDLAATAASATLTEYVAYGATYTASVVTGASYTDYLADGSTYRVSVDSAGVTQTDYNPAAATDSAATATSANVAASNGTVATGLASNGTAATGLAASATPSNAAAVNGTALNGTVANASAATATAATLTEYITNGQTYTASVVAEASYTDYVANGATYRVSVDAAGVTQTDYNPTAATNAAATDASAATATAATLTEYITNGWTYTASVVAEASYTDYVANGATYRVSVDAAGVTQTDYNPPAATDAAATNASTNPQASLLPASGPTPASVPLDVTGADAPTVAAATVAPAAASPAAVGSGDSNGSWNGYADGSARWEDGRKMQMTWRA